MKTFSRLALTLPLAVAAVVLLSNSHFKFAPDLAAVQAAGQYPNQAPPDQGPDPADANQAPAGASYTTDAPPPDQGDDSYYAEQPTATATEPPPPLPGYMQPPAPGDGYIWTPGYWAWGPYGYYWVPGVWVEPPYMGALWTPGYWGFYGSRYMWYPGHWGMHIGFYGGINYGFGYMGLGYEGGYWNSGRFFYNRVYNHIDERMVHNVYSYRANGRMGNNGNMGNNGRGYNNARKNNMAPGNNMDRPSYRGGPNGVQSMPRPSEGAAFHEPTAPRMDTQAQHAQNYSTMRGQYASENHGRPATAAESRPLHADYGAQPQQHNNGKGQQGKHNGGNH